MLARALLSFTVAWAVTTTAYSALGQTSGFPRAEIYRPAVHGRQSTAMVAPGQSVRSDILATEDDSQEATPPRRAFRYPTPPGDMPPLLRPPPSYAFAQTPHVLRMHYYKEYRWYSQTPEFSDPDYLAGYNGRYKLGEPAAWFFVQPHYPAPPVCPRAGYP